MFRRKSPDFPALPEPPKPEELLEDLAKAGPDDIVFTVDLNALNTSANSLDNNDSNVLLQLPKRFEVIHEIAQLLLEGQALSYQRPKSQVGDWIFWWHEFNWNNQV